MSQLALKELLELIELGVEHSQHSTLNELATAHARLLVRLSLAVNHTGTWNAGAARSRCEVLLGSILELLKCFAFALEHDSPVHEIGNLGQSFADAPDANFSSSFSHGDSELLQVGSGLISGIDCCTLFGKLFEVAQDSSLLLALSLPQLMPCEQLKHLEENVTLLCVVDEANTVDNSGKLNLGSNFSIFLVQREQVAVSRVLLTNRQLSTQIQNAQQTLQSAFGRGARLQFNLLDASIRIQQLLHRWRRQVALCKE